MGNSISDVVTNIERVIRGKRETIETVVSALLARGHILIEDVPGVGKTMLARSLACSISAECKRVQCTPDLLPSDVTGVSVFHPKEQEFKFRKGPVFSHILLADEINRATPRTQSALLEAMEERQVSVDGTTHPLPDPFLLMATQNPIELAGTFPLPEAQLDRFLVQVSIGYPDDERELEIMAAQKESHPIQDLKSVLSTKELLQEQKIASERYIHTSLMRYIQQIVSATRNNEHALYGSSPRGALALMHLSKAHATLHGETFVTPDHIKRLAPDVLGHRIVVQPRSRVQGMTGRKVIEDVLRVIEVPVDFEPVS